MSCVKKTCVVIMHAACLVICMITRHVFWPRDMSWCHQTLSKPTRHGLWPQGMSCSYQNQPRFFSEPSPALLAWPDCFSCPPILAWLNIQRIEFLRLESNEWCVMEDCPRPWIIVSLKGTMGTMGRDPQVNEPENFIARPPGRIMTFPETRVDLNRLIKKIKPE